MLSLLNSMNLDESNVMLFPIFLTESIQWDHSKYSLLDLKSSLHWIYDHGCIQLRRLNISIDFGQSEATFMKFISLVSLYFNIKNNQSKRRSFVPGIEIGIVLKHFLC